jgi:hypothetical protein
MMAPSMMKSPYLIAGGVGLFVLLLMMTRSGGGGGNSGVASQASADSANVQLATLTTQQNIAQLGVNGQLAAGAQAGNTAFLGSLMSYLTNHDNNLTTANIQGAEIAGKLTLNRDNIAATEQLAPQMATINGKNAQALATINGATASDIARVQSNTATSLANIQSQTALQLGQLYAPDQTMQDIQSAGAALGLVTGGGGSSGGGGMGGMMGGGSSGGGGGMNMQSIMAMIMGMFGGMMGGSSGGGGGGGMMGGGSSGGSSGGGMDTGQMMQYAELAMMFL